MHCTECDAVVPPHREFCPQCGTPTNLRPREGRRSARSPDELKRNRRNVLIIAAAGVLGLAIMGQGSWFTPTIDLNPSDRNRGPAVVEAQQLFEAYRNDEEAAEDRYGDREMVVTGEFVRIAPDGSGDPDLRLKTSDPEAPLGIDMIQASHEQSTRLRPGQIVTVSCQRVDRTGEERWLRNCAIQTVREGSASPTPRPSAAGGGGGGGGGGDGDADADGKADSNST